MIEFLVALQTLILLGGIGFYFYKNRKKKPSGPVVIVESLPEGLSKGFGYVKGKSVVLNENKVPYLYKTFLEAQRNVGKVKGVIRKL